MIGSTGAVVAACILVGASARAAGGGVEVWATGDGVRVNPETGRYLEDRTDIHKDYPTGDYRRRNAVWDATKRRVTLHAARNEFVAFQLVVGRDAKVEGVEVRFDRLVGPGGKQIAGRHVALMPAWYVKVEKPSNGYPKTSLGPGWYADALPASRRAGRASFGIPSARNHIGPTQRNQTVWVDVFVPRDRSAAPPGEYRGRVTVTGAGATRQLEVLLRVWDFALPDEINCRGDIWNGSLRRMPPEQELLWYQMAHRHRFHPGVAGYQPKLTGSGVDVKVDWTDYDKRLGRYFDGSAFTEASGYWGPGRGAPIPHIQLPFNCNKRGRRGGWPVPIGPDWKPDKQYEAAWLAVCRQFHEHFDRHATWRKVRKIAFLGGLDESYNDAAYAKMIYYCKLLRRGLGDGWFAFRIDGGYNWKARAGPSRASA